MSENKKISSQTLHSLVLQARKKAYALYGTMSIEFISGKTHWPDCIDIAPDLDAVVLHFNVGNCSHAVGLKIDNNTFE